MTRTARAVYPRAVTKDRSVNRSGLDAAMKKGGAGPHAWGALDEESYLERAGEEDAALEADNDAFDDEAELHFDTRTGTVVGERGRADSTESDSSDTNKGRARSASTASIEHENERARARSFRTGSFSGNRTIDLAAIARTSVAVSNGSPVEPNGRTPFGRSA